MKLVRHGQAGKERPGLIDSEGKIRDLGGIYEDFGPAFFANDGIRRVRSVHLPDLPVIAKGARLGPCVAQPGNFIAVGLNYVQHALEAGRRHAPRYRWPRHPGATCFAVGRAVTLWLELRLLGC